MNGLAVVLSSTSCYPGAFPLGFALDALDFLSLSLLIIGFPCLLRCLAALPVLLRSSTSPSCPYSNRRSSPSFPMHTAGRHC